MGSPHPRTAEVQDQCGAYRQRLVEHSHKFSREEAEDSHFPVGGDRGHFFPVRGEGEAGGIGLVFRKFIQVCVRFVFPLHVLGELEFSWQAGPVFQHSRPVGGDNDAKLGVEADLGEGRGVHLVEDVEGLVASPPVIDEDLPRGLFRAGYDGNGISGIVDPLALARVVTSDDKKGDNRERRAAATQSEA